MSSFAADEDDADSGGESLPTDSFGGLTLS